MSANSDNLQGFPQLISTDITYRFIHLHYVHFIFNIKTLYMDLHPNFRFINKFIVCLSIIWASSRQNWSLGFPTKRDSNQSPHLQRPARKFNFACWKFRYGTFPISKTEGADQTAWMHRLVCAFVVCKASKTGFLASRPISAMA